MIISVAARQFDDAAHFEAEKENIGGPRASVPTMSSVPDILPRGRSHIPQPTTYELRSSSSYVCQRAVR